MTDHTTSARARLAFVGSGVDGSVDAAAFGEALLGLDQACRAANRCLNEDRASVTVRLRADMRPGSVVWSPEVWMTLASQASLTPVVNVVALLAILGLAGNRAMKVGQSVLALLRDYKDTVVQEPDAEAEISRDGVTVKIKGKATKVDAALWKCSREMGVRQGLGRVLEPLRLPGVEGLEVRSLSPRAKKPLAVFAKEDIPADTAFQEPGPTTSTDLIDGERDAILRVVRPALEGSYDWTFSEDGKQTFGAPMRDEGFLERRDRGEVSFRKGILMKVRLRYQATVRDGKPQLRQSVVRVLDVLTPRRPKQLLLSEKREDVKEKPKGRRRSRKDDL